METLPDTIRVIDRSSVQAKQDVVTAEAAAKAIEPRFLLSKYVISLFVHVDIRSDGSRPSLSDAIRDFIESTRR